MKLQFKQWNMLMVVLAIAVSSMIPSAAAAANVSIDYIKQGSCNSSILVRVGDYCDYVVTITIPSTASTDLSVEIIMPDNDTTVMQMSKPQVTYVGSNFANSQSIYDPTITMTSQLNSTQYNDAQMNFGTVVNNGVAAPSNSTQSIIQIGFRSVVISNPSYQANGSQYWVTVGIEYNNVSEIWIGQALFIFANTSNLVAGQFTVGTVNSSSLQVAQGSPFALAVPVIFSGTFASNFVFTVTNNNPSQLGLCSAYVQSASSGFWHLPTLGYEISTGFTTALTSNQISIRLGQIVNSQSYSGLNSTLYIVVYGRVFKTDSISSYSAGTVTAQVTSSRPTASQSYTITAQPATATFSLNGSLPTFSITPQTGSVGIYQTLKMTISMTVPSGFIAPVVIDLNGAGNTSTPSLKACSVVFRSAGENMGSSDPQCADTSFSRRTYSSSVNSTVYDQLSYDYGVLQSTGTRSTAYADAVNIVSFDAIFQVMNTTDSMVWPTVSMTMGNNTIWLGNMGVNVTSMSYNVTPATQPTFALSYENNATSNQSTTALGYNRLFYYDIYTKANGVYTPMTVRITTNETSPGSGIPAATICSVKVVYVGQNLPCVIQPYYNQDQSPYITYASRYNQRKNDTAYIQFGPLCNYQSTQTNDDYGRIRLGVYVKVEAALGDGQSTYVSLDVYYTPSNLWIGQILYTGSLLGTSQNVVGTPYFFPFNSSVQTVQRNALTVVNYGLKVPPGSLGTYSSLNSAITGDSNQQTSVCRVDISPARGRNVPCSNDVSSVFTYNSNGVSSIATSNLGVICSISSNASTVNMSTPADADTLTVQVFILPTTQSGGSFGLTLSNLQPSGLAALGTLSSTFNSGSTSAFGSVSSINPLNATVYRQTNDTNNGSTAYLGQDVFIRTQFVLARNLTTQACYSLAFQFGITAGTADAAYFTTAFVISTGDNLMCMKSKATPVLSNGGSTLYKASMFLDLGTLCYYPIDPTNITASTLIVQANVRVPVSTTVPVNGQLSVATAALINNNQSTVNTSFPLTVVNYTGYGGSVLFSNDTASVVPSTVNGTVQCAIRVPVTYDFKVYLPTYAQGRLELLISSAPISNFVTVNILSANIISAGTNVQSFMAEYTLGTKYQWRYSSSVSGSTYQDTAYLDLGVVTNTGTSALQGNFSNLTDNFIVVRASGYVTDSPSAEQNYTFVARLSATYAGKNISGTNSLVVVRNGTEKPVMIVNHTDLTSGVYNSGSTYSGQIQYSHANQSNAECVNAQIIVYLPTWASFLSYNSTTASTNYTTDSTSYVLFNLGTLFFNDMGTLTFTLNIGTSSQMAAVYQRYNPSLITIPYEFMCMKRPRANVAFYPATKVFAFPDIISLPTSMTPVSSYPTLLGGLDPCQFKSSVPGSDASLARTTGWQTGYRSDYWMLSGSTYLQINFGNLTFIKGIQLTVPAAFAPILTIQLGYSWDGDSFAVHPTTYPVNGSASYAVPLTDGVSLRSLRIYVIDVVQPSDLLTKTSGFSVNITGSVNSTNVTVANVCPAVSNTLAARTVLVAPTGYTGLTYNNDVYVCDETTTRTSFACHVLFNGVTSPSPVWTALNTTVANIIRFVFDINEQIQSLYGYGQDGASILRSDDRGLTWVVTDMSEYANITGQCGTSTKVCSEMNIYSVMMSAPGMTITSGTNSWQPSVQGLWTPSTTGVLAFDWFDI